MRAPLVALVAVLLAGCGPAPATRTPAPPSVAEPTAVAAATVAATTAPIATPSPLPSIALPLCPGTSASDAGTRSLCLERATVYLDASVAPTDAAAIATQVREDLAAVERDFAWTLRTHAVIHVFATDASYLAGLTSTFGYSAATAQWVADNSVAFFEPTAREIVVDWAAVSARRPIAALRHELTHLVTLEACAPRCDLVPAWLNEGEARLAEALMPGGDWRLARVRYEAASMVMTGTTIPLASLASQSQWNSFVDWDGYYKYQEAARVTQLLRDDIGDDAIARLYALIRRGNDVAHAYLALTGRSFDSFMRTLDDRVRDGVTDGPAIALVSPPADDDAASFLLFGFAPSASVTLRISSRHVDETRALVVSPQGASFGEIDLSYPPGTYHLEASSGDVRASATFVKHGGRTLRAAIP